MENDSFHPRRLYLGREKAGFPETLKGRSLLFVLLFSRLPSRLFAVLLIVFVTISGLSAPYFQRAFIDGLNNGKAVGDLTRLIALAVFLGIVSQTFNLGIRVWLSREASIANRWLSRQMYRNALNLTPQCRMKKTIGETVAHFATDVQTSTTILEDFLPSFLGAVGPLVGAPIAFSVLYDLPIRWVALVTLSSVGVCFLFSFRQGRFFSRYKRLAELRISVVNEWLQNIRILRVLGWMESFENRIQEKRIAETDNRLNMVTNGSVMNAIAQAAPLLINATGVFTLIRYYKHEISPGDIFAVLWILGVFLNRPTRMIPWTLVIFLDALTSIRRLENYFALEVEPDDASSPTLGPTKLNSGLHFVGLNLKTENRVLLDDVNLSVKPGEFVAIVGEVGSGKTVMLNSLVRDTIANFQNFEIDGNNALNFSLGELRRYFAYVPQDGFVMSATIRENVLFEYDVSDKNDAQVIEALRLAQFNLQQENGMTLDTEIGERGVNFSGGQRQRLALARAHLSNRPILLLDDCLSAVDVMTEQRLMHDLLCGAWTNKTRILVTHRLSVLEHVDRVFVMEKGKLREQHA